MSQTCKPILSEVYSRNYLGFWLSTVYHFREFTISLSDTGVEITEMNVIGAIVLHNKCITSQTFLWELPIILLMGGKNNSFDKISPSLLKVKKKVTCSEA